MMTTTMMMMMILLTTAGQSDGQAGGGVWHGDVREVRGVQHRHLRSDAGGAPSLAAGHGESLWTHDYIMTVLS